MRKVFSFFASSTFQFYFCSFTHTFSWQPRWETMRNVPTAPIKDIIQLIFVHKVESTVVLSLLLTLKFGPNPASFSVFKKIKKMISGKIGILQWITKKHVPPVFQPCVFPVYLRNRLRYNKSIYIFLYQFLKSSQLEQVFFKSDDTISWYWQKC